MQDADIGEGLDRVKQRRSPMALKVCLPLHYGSKAKVRPVPILLKNSATAVFRVSNIQDVESRLVW
jgi:hypothetical protein